MALDLLQKDHKFVAYVISFWVIALYWLAHHRLFRIVTRYDYGVLMLNLVLLFCVAFLPYPSAVLGDHGDTVAGTVFYAACVAVTGAASTLLGWYVVSIGSSPSRSHPSWLGATCSEAWSCPRCSCSPSRSSC